MVNFSNWTVFFLIFLVCSVIAGTDYEMLRANTVWNTTAIAAIEYLKGKKNRPDLY